VTYSEYETILGADLCRELWERTYDRRGSDCAPVMLNTGRGEVPLTVNIAIGWANRLAESWLR